MSVQDIIKQKLDEIEKKENVTIIHAIESGSRAWGFESPDSDYDVRFIYVRKKNDYLKLEKFRDVIEWEINDVYDINGWDLKKFLQLARNSNPTVFEWNYSPLIYKTTDFYKSLKSVCDRYFSCKAGIYHYLSMAENDYRNYFKEDNVRLKKYFYVIRPLLACRWIKENKCPPPVLFSELYDIMENKAIKSVIDELLEIKKTTSELGTGARIKILDDCIEANISEFKNVAESMEDDKNHDWEMLDKIFLSGIEYGENHQKKWL